MRAFTVIDCEQRSSEWRQARAGRLTGSVAHEIMSKGRKDGEESAGRRNLRQRLALEQLNGRPYGEREFQSQAMRDGVEREPDAIAAYEVLTGRVVNQTGFLQHYGLMAGVSLDGHVGDFEIVCELKCPEANAHIEALKTGRIPGKYEWQCLHALWITGANRCDFVSFNPEFPEDKRLKFISMNRLDSQVAEYERSVRTFLGQVDELVAELRGLKGDAA